MIEFYKRTGEPCCYSPDGQHIYLWQGAAVAYVKASRVYGFDGRQLGWYERGWLYDRQNRPALFTPEALGGPIRPTRSVKPVKNTRQLKPAKGVREVSIVQPVRCESWSSFADQSYFNQ